MSRRRNPARIPAAAFLLAAAAALLLLLSSPAPGHAQTSDQLLLGNTGSTQSGVNVGADDVTQPFRTGKNPTGYTLTRIQLSASLLTGGETGPSASEITVTLRADSSGDPADSALATFSFPNTWTGNALNEFTLATAHDLDPDTPYHIHITATKRAFVQRSAASQVDGGSASDWSFSAHRYKNSDGDWVTSTGAIRMELHGTIKPRSPGAPTGLTATEGHRAAKLEWTAPADPGSSPITGYEVTTDDATSYGPTGSTDTSYILAGLVLNNGTVRVRAVNAVGKGPWSDAVTGTTIGPATVTIAGDGEVVEGADAAFTLRASKPALSPSNPLNVRVSVSESGNMVASADEGAKTVGFAVDALTAKLRVPTVDDGVAQGHSTVTAEIQTDTDYTVGSASSATVRVIDNASLPPGQVIPEKAQSGDGTLTLRWSSPVVSGSSTPVHQMQYAILRWRPNMGGLSGWRNIPDSGAGGANHTSYTIPGRSLENGVKYHYMVRAWNLVGPSESYWHESNYGIPIDTPELSAGNVRATSVHLRWPALEVDGKYDFYAEEVHLGWRMKAGNGEYGDWQWLWNSRPGGIHQTGYGVGGLARDTAYTFQVRARLWPGNHLVGPVSAPVTVTTGGSAPASTGLSAEGRAGQAVLRWTVSDNRDAITGYEYRRKAGDGAFGAWRNIRTNEAFNTNRTSDNIFGYYTYDGLRLRRTGGDSGNAAHSYNAAYIVGGLSNGTPYTFEVRSRNHYGPGAPSNAVTATPRNSHSPPSLENFELVDKGGGEYDMIWSMALGTNPPAGGQFYIDIPGELHGNQWFCIVPARLSHIDGGGMRHYTYRVTSPVPCPKYATPSWYTYSWEDNGYALESGKLYDIRLYMFHVQGDALTDKYRFRYTTSAPAQALNPPGATSLAAAPAGGSRIDLFWTTTDPVSTSYEVEWSADGETGWQAVEPPDDGADTIHGHEGLTAETTYYYRVRGVNGDGPGPWSGLAAATTLEKANSPATGEGIITGAARVAGTLAVDPSRIADEDGLENAVFSYQWQAGGADISGATDSTYVPVVDDAGRAIGVRVSFTDDRGFEETLTGAAGMVPADDYTVNEVWETGNWGRVTVGGSATGVIEKPGDRDFFGVNLSRGRTYRIDVAGHGDVGALEQVRLYGVFVYAEDLECSGAYDDPGVTTYVLTAGHSAPHSVAVRAEGDGTGVYRVSVSESDDTGTGCDTAPAAEPQAANSPATGLPAISGAVRVGETLTADTTGIADEDGLTNASFSYQWQADDAEISGATDATYVPVVDDVGKTITVQVTFTDDAGNEEELTSAATDAVEARPNRPATGAPTISGTAQVGETLTADTSGIADEDGLDNAAFAYQWQADGSETQDATDATYTPVVDDVGKAVSVTVSFTDDAGNEEELTSAVTDAVEPETQEAQAANTPATGTPAITGTAQVGETLTADTTGIADEDGLTNASFSYQWQADGADIQDATDSSYTLADADEGKAISVRVTFTDDSGNEETLTSAATDAVEARPNRPATGALTITGTARVGELLTADVSNIMDDDGLDKTAFAYQWQADSTDLSGATGSSYTLADSDEGKAMSVTVSFTDYAGHEESFTSTATAAVGWLTTPTFPGPPAQATH